MRRTNILLLGLIAILTGLALARLKFQVSYQLLAIGIMLPVLRRVSKRFFIAATLLFCLFVGLVRGQMYMSELGKYQSLYKQQATIYVVATTDANYSQRKQLSFTASNIEVVSPFQQRLVGELTIEGYGAPMIFRGDHVKVQGKIYPTLGGKQGSIRFAQIEVVGREENYIDKVRHRFSAGIFNALPEPAASFALGLLVGQRSTLPDYLADALMVTGLTHIVAVSGYNLTIIVQAVQKLRAKRSRYQAAVMALALVLVFVLLVGSSPSIIRASLVSLLSVLCWYYGRRIKPLLLIMLVAAITAMYKPTYLWSDVGWYLSFLAFFGVLVLAPQLTVRLSTRGAPKLIKLIIIETVCAQIMTMPIILYIFGRTSFLGVAANVMVVPFVPLAMFLSLIGGIAGMFVKSLAGLVALPAKFLLNYMLGVTTIFSELPHITVERVITWQQMVFVYVLLVLLVIILWLKNRDKNDIIAREY